MNEELKIIIRAELEQFKKAMKDAISGVKSVANESKKASKQIDGFTADVNQQGKALSDLKRKYVDLAVAHGKESKAAKDAAEQIKKLSAEYKTNKQLASDLANEANSFDMSFGEESKKNVNDTKEEVNDLQGSLEAIRNLDFAQVLLGAFGPEVRKHIRSAREEFNLAGIYFRQFFENFNKNSELYKDIGGWEGWGEAIKGAGLSAKYTTESLGQAFSQLGKGISEALGGTVGVLLTLIADLVIVIGLTKNALSVAKEIKDMANQASKSGMDTSTYQEWGYVLKQVGIEEDKLSDFTKKLAERQNEVRDGGEEATKAFEALGISAEEAMGSSQEELFRKSVSALQNISNEAERTSASFRLFSDDATDLTNLLYLTNQETQSLIGNYYALGAAPSDNLINKSKTLSSSTQNLSYAWQGLKNTLAEWVIPAVIGVVQWITTAVAYINVFLQGVFGVEMKTKKAAEGIESMGGGLDKVSENADGATDSIKELLRYTMGFDELNVIPKQSSDSGSGGGGAAGGYSNAAINPELPVIEVPDMSKFRAFMEEYGSIIQGILTWSLIGIGVILAVIGFMSGNIALGILGISLAGLGIGVGAAGGSESHWAKLGDAIKKTLKAIGDYFTHVGKEIERWWNDVVAWFQELGVAIGQSWNDILDWFVYAGSEISRWWNDVCAWFSQALTDIGQFFVDAWNWIVSVWNGAGAWFSGIWATICEAFANVGQWFSEIFSAAWNWVVNIWNGAGEWFSGIWQNICGAFSDIGNWFFTAFTEAWNWVVEAWQMAGEWFSGIWQNICGAFSAVGSWFSTVFTNAWNWVVGAWKGAGKWFSDIWTNIKSGASQAWEGIKGVFSKVGDWFKDTFSKAWEKVKNVFSTGGKIFDGIKDGIASTFKTVVNGIITGINKVIKVPFDAINKMLNKIRNSEFLSITPFKNLWKENPLSIPQIPKLATGGIATRSILANIGERGKEAVLPLENNTGWMDILAARINQNTQSRIVLMVDGKELGYAAINNINNITKQTGTLQLQLI